MNRYGAMAQRYWQQWLPEQYASMTDPDGFFSALGEEVARQIDELADKLAGDDRLGEGYLAQVGRLMAARAQAEELVLRERILLAPEDAGEDVDDEPASGGELPLVVGPQPPVVGGGGRGAAGADRESGGRGGAVMSQVIADSPAFWVALICGLTVAIHRADSDRHLPARRMLRPGDHLEHVPDSVDLPRWSWPA